MSETVEEALSVINKNIDTLHEMNIPYLFLYSTNEKDIEFRGSLFQSDMNDFVSAVTEGCMLLLEKERSLGIN